MPPSCTRDLLPASSHHFSLSRRLGFPGPGQHQVVSRYTGDTSVPGRARFHLGSRGRERHGVEIVDTSPGFRHARLAVTPPRDRFVARTAAVSMTGFASSVIGCKVEAGIEAMLALGDTPDGRPGASVLVFAFNAEGLATRLVERVGQTVLTCVTTARFDGLPDAPERATVGGVLRHFGDKFQSSKGVDGRRYWRVPVMEGEFSSKEVRHTAGDGGGNLMILARPCRGAGGGGGVGRRDAPVPRFILPFPGASSAPAARSARGAIRTDRVDTRRTARRFADGSGGRASCRRRVNSVLEIVIDGVDRQQ